MKKLKIHFTGIKGVGMTPLAIIAKEAGFSVTGSDIGEEFITDKALETVGIHVNKGFAEENVGESDLLITTTAHGGLNNPEVVFAISKNIKVVTQGEAVGLFMKGEIFGKEFRGISVAGTHGKTTTTGMIATIFKSAEYDPSYVIGTGDVGSLGLPGHFGKGKYFIAEADEYAVDPKNNKTAKFLLQKPNIAVITNVEFDHPDIYLSIDELKSAFSVFANQVTEKGVLVVCGDDHEIKSLSIENKNKVITYGFNLENDYVIKRVSPSGDSTFFWVSVGGADLGEFMIGVAGEHNVQNALASIIVSLESGLSIDEIKKGIKKFVGSRRRLEFMGMLGSGALVYDDYAHHPTEIKKTLSSLKLRYPRKKIICIFQPHTYSRTKKLFDEFIRSFSGVETVLVTDIYTSLREEPDSSVSSKILCEEINKFNKEAIYLPSLSDVIKYLDKTKPRSDNIIVTMGAGDIYKIHSELSFE